MTHPLEEVYDRMGIPTGWYLYLRARRTHHCASLQEGRHIFVTLQLGAGAFEEGGGDGVGAVNEGLESRNAACLAVEALVVAR